VLLDRDGAIVGYLTSSRWSPALRCTVALAWVDLVDGQPPGGLTCDGSAATIAPIPFYDPTGARLRG
jgi:glycine cleavage system aminomethyltransferase T